MQINQQDDGKHGVFQLLDKGIIAGEMSYTWAGEGMLIIDSTQVSDDYRGQSVGRTLLTALVDFVRAKAVKVIPLCPYAKAAFDKDASIRDVLRDQ